MLTSRRVFIFAVSLLAVVAAFSLSCDGSTTTDVPSPTPGHPLSRTLPTSITPPPGAAPMTGVTAVAAGAYHTCALTSRGGVRCWGANGAGQVGDGTTLDRAIPVDVGGLAQGVVQIAAGFDHTCALTGEGAVKCWGQDARGAIGDGTIGGPRTEPADVLGLAGGVTAVAAGRDHTCALTAGKVMCWGRNTFGQLGDGTSEKVQATPVGVVGMESTATAITAGWYHTCALTEELEVRCWGNNQSGQLGNGQMDSAPTRAPVTVAGLNDEAIAVVAGGAHNCVLTKTGGVKCWGINNYGQLGDGTTVDRATPVDVVALEGPVVAIAAGTGHTCAITASHGVTCWGHCYYGQLGDGTSGWGNISPQPVEVSGISSGVAAIAPGRFHTCALTDAGAVKCFGRNGFGEIGDGTRIERSTPVDVIATASGD